MINSNSFQESLNLIKRCLNSQNLYIKGAIFSIIDGIIDMPLSLTNTQLLNNKFKLLEESIKNYNNNNDFQFKLKNSSKYLELRTFGSERQYMVEQIAENYYRIAIINNVGSSNSNNYYFNQEKYFSSNSILSGSGIKISLADMPEFIEKLKTIKTMVNFI